MTSFTWSTSSSSSDPASSPAFFTPMLKATPIPTIRNEIPSECEKCKKSQFACQCPREPRLNIARDCGYCPVCHSTSLSLCTCNRRPPQYSGLQQYTGFIYDPTSIFDKELTKQCTYSYSDSNRFCDICKEKIHSTHSYFRCIICPDYDCCQPCLTKQSGAELDKHQFLLITNEAGLVACQGIKKLLK